MAETTIQHLYQLSNVLCFGEIPPVLTTVTTNPQKVNTWILDIYSNVYSGVPNTFQPNDRIIGLDIEWRPNLPPNQNQHNPVATLQLCYKRKCLIYQLLHITGPIPEYLPTLLRDNFFTFVGVGVRADLEKLMRDYLIGINTNSVELGRVAALRFNRIELETMSLKKLCNEVLGKEMHKPYAVTTSEWDSRWLTPDQVMYACLDAYVSSEIGRYLNAQDFYD